MAEKAKHKIKISNIKGDKLVWIIALLLCLFSLVCIFSATSRQVTSDVNRLHIVRDQLVTVLIGVVVMVFCFACNFKWFKALSKYGFWFSLVLLIMLVGHVRLGPIRALNINDAYRIISFFGVQVHVYEIVKVAMIMYIAWALDALKRDDFPVFNRLTESFEKLSFLQNRGWKEAIFICIPVFLVCGLVLVGGTSSALFIGGILILTLIIGGLPFRDILVMGAIAVLGLASAYGLFCATRHNDKPLFSRMATVESRLKGTENDEILFEQSTVGSEEYYRLKDKLLQIHGAKIAIKEGGILGKGPGQSTQKYLVPVISEDYMFSFIVEEYGLFGGIVLLILYLSLLARGSIIVRNCDDGYGKMAVGGLCLLITCQAFFHVLINCDLGIHTGQTLPMISNGTSSFLCFCIAFGIILSVSKSSEKKVDKETRNAQPLVDLSMPQAQTDQIKAESTQLPDPEEWQESEEWPEDEDNIDETEEV